MLFFDTILKYTNRFVSIVLCFFILSCVSSKKDFSMEKLKPRERIYVGRVIVDFNGNLQPQCELYLNSDLAPSIKLEADGHIYYRTDRLQPRLSKISCYHQESARHAAWHVQDLPLDNLNRSEDQKEIIYFGEIQIKWNVDPNQTIESAKNEPETRELLRVGRVKNSGDLTVQVTSDVNAAERRFYSEQSDAKATGFLVKEQVLKINKGI